MESIINASPAYKRTCSSTVMKNFKHPLTCGSGSSCFYIKILTAGEILLYIMLIAFDDSKDIDARDNENHVTREFYTVPENKLYLWHSF